MLCLYYFTFIGNEKQLCEKCINIYHLKFDSVIESSTDQLW